MTWLEATSSTPLPLSTMSARLLNRLVLLVIRAVLLVTARCRYEGLDQVPRSGGALVVSNHLSNLDTIILPYAVHRARRRPLVMMKVEVFKVPVFGPALRRVGHIGVERGAPNAAAALAPAAAALRAGNTVLLYPEGTVNVSPERGLVEARTGVARLALDAGVPVVPVAQWGPQVALPPRGQLSALRPPRLLGWFRSGRRARRPVCRVLFGEPISVAELRAAAGPDAAEPDYRAVTDLVMDRLGALVAQVSGIPESATAAGGTPFLKRTAA